MYCELLIHKRLCYTTFMLKVVLGRISLRMKIQQLFYSATVQEIFYYGSIIHTVYTVSGWSKYLMFITAAQLSYNSSSEEVYDTVL